MDACKRQFRNDSFQCITDKTTLDEALCHTHDEVGLSAIMSKISRVLTRNAVFIEVISGDTAENSYSRLSRTIALDMGGYSHNECIFGSHNSFRVLELQRNDL
jgi:hypothetical protein